MERSSLEIAGELYTRMTMRESLSRIKDKMDYCQEEGATFISRLRCDQVSMEIVFQGFKIDDLRADLEKALKREGLI